MKTSLGSQPTEPTLLGSTQLVEAVTKAILFQDCGSTEDWRDNTDLGEAAIDAYRRHTQCAATPAQEASEPVKVPSIHPDDNAVDQFAAAMKAKLGKKRTEGRNGWQQCDAHTLSTMLAQHIAKGDPVDVANLAMMLHQNGQPISPYSLNQDPAGIRALAADSITGALMLGAQGADRPPDDHWLTPFWDMARAEHRSGATRPIVPDGWMLVPIEMTPLMLATAHEASYDTRALPWRDAEKGRYKRMLEAAPIPPVTPPANTQGPVDLQDLANKLVIQIEVIRDKDGYFSHPEYPILGEEVAIREFLGCFGLECHFTWMESEVEDSHPAWLAYRNGKGCAEWNPSVRAGWTLISIFETEDGPVALYVRAARTKLDRS